MDFNQLNTLRRDYGQSSLLETNLPHNPITLFQDWLKAAVATDFPDATAMVLATVDEHGHPDTRVVLMKGLDTGLIFYTNYESAKGKQIAIHPYGALNFYWFFMVRQVRIRGKIEKLTPKENADYFNSRPLDSQISAIISPQSQVITDRQTLEEKATNYAKTNEVPYTCPYQWGGYRLIPNEFEFFQGRDARLHDRIRYIQKEAQWHIERLAP